MMAVCLDVDSSIDYEDWTHELEKAPTMLKAYEGQRIGTEGRAIICTRDGGTEWDS